jgi:hypothetical protein
LTWSENQTMKMKPVLFPSRISSSLAPPIW